MLTDETTVRTGRASGYLQQLCKHFGHKTKTVFSPTQGVITFDFGTARLMAEPDLLTLNAEAATEEELLRLKRVLTSHLERFAFRENLTITWDT